MIVSPCISICRMDPVTGYCYGCGRSNEEKRMWKEEKKLLETYQKVMVPNYLPADFIPKTAKAPRQKTTQP